MNVKSIHFRMTAWYAGLLVCLLMLFGASVYFGLRSYRGNTSVFDQSGAPIATAGQITGTQTTARQVQLAMKIIF